MFGLGAKKDPASTKSPSKTKTPPPQSYEQPSIPGASPERPTPNKRFPPRTSSHISPQKLLRNPLSMQGSTNSQSSSERNTADLSRLSLSSGHSSQNGTPDTGSLRNSTTSIPPTQHLPIRQRHVRDPSGALPQPSTAELSDTTSRTASFAGAPQMSSGNGSPVEEAEGYKLQYFHEPYGKTVKPRQQSTSPSGGLPLPPSIGLNFSNRSLPELKVQSDGLRPPDAAFLPHSATDTNFRGRDHTRHSSMGPGLSPSPGPGARHGRALSSQRYSPDNRPHSYIDMLQHIPYSQQVAPQGAMNNNFLKSAVGNNASLIDHQKTLQMYRANVKNINEPAIQYEFAIFMVQAAMETPDGQEKQDMLRESKQILQKLADRSYPFAQYYLGDGYASGLFNKGREDEDRAFPLFVAASKHGHAEAGYRAALCYEFGWGCRRDIAKAVQFYQASASKNHPGAATRLGLACLNSTMGLTGKYKQGVGFLKRAAESADTQYNSGPFELGRLHETGHGDSIFKDEAYAAQLFTRSAELGHAESNLLLGKAYEHGLLGCPKDAALSIHFYTGAAQGGLPEAMMALTAWYLFGAEPFLEKNENEAFEWARQAADLGYAKAEYAVGYFKEVGIGCRQDSLEANVWYVKAADQGETRAKDRLKIIREAASGGEVRLGQQHGDGGKAKKGMFKKFGL